MLEPFILFQVAEADYAVRSDQVQQIEMVEKVTHVPNAPHFVDGVVYLRNQVVPVVNLRARFGFPKVSYDLRSRLVVVRLERRVVGLAVDSAREFIKLDTETMLPPPEGLQGPNLDYLEGVISTQERLLLVVNLAKLLDFSEQAALAALAE
jgi:purine-binding chemotaxis protein CheW